jgi:uncharacterized membrane protein YsdA (DUF1294 family)
VNRRLYDALAICFVMLMVQNCISAVVAFRDARAADRAMERIERQGRLK